MIDAPARFRTLGLILALSLAAIACGASSDVPTDQIGLALTVVADGERGATTSILPATVPPTASAAPTASTTAAPDPLRTWIATARDEVTQLAAHDGPDGSPLPLPFPVPNPHQFGGPLTLMVTEGQPGDTWVRVQLPIRPNGQEGWVRTAEYELSETRIRAEVALSETAVRVFDGDELIAESQAVIGADDTPTPIGTFYVAAKKRNTPEEYYLGTWALVLSSFSEVLPSFSGGLPVIAVHGTDDPEQAGEAITFGCVRVPNDVIEFLAENVPIGAPVHISV